MTILICGISGLVGRELAKLCDNFNISYIGTYNNNYVKNGIKINFFDLNEIKNCMLNNKISVCINSIVERKVETCENDWDSTKKIKNDITTNIAKICNKLNIHLIHISTDYVFDGKNPPYLPSSLNNPLQNYGISKLISELKVKTHSNKYTIIRVPVLYTDNIQNLMENAVTLIGKKVLNRIENYKEDNFSIRRPVYILDFCYFIIDIINKNICDNSIYHFYNPHDILTKYKISNIISDFLNKKNNIIPINDEINDGVDRPKDTFLNDNKYNILDYSFTPFNLGIQKCFNKLYHPLLINNSEYLKDILFLIDLDGTLIDSEKLHFEGYKKSLKDLFNYDLIFDEYIKEINSTGIDNFLIKNFGIEQKNKIKKYKNNYIETIQNIDLTKNSDKLINFIENNNINHVIVTNTSKETTETFKKKVPILNKLKNWITRENYINAKPSNECYNLAKQTYGKNEKFIIGVENTYNGFLSIKDTTKCIYILIDKNNLEYNKFKNEDVYLINDFEQIFN